MALAASDFEPAPLFVALYFLSQYTVSYGRVG
jgi:hypothetical protein